jgi:hypothetical protein
MERLFNDQILAVREGKSVVCLMDIQNKKGTPNRVPSISNI